MRRMQYSRRSAESAAIWQNDVRSQLARLLKIDDLLRDRHRIAINPSVVGSSTEYGYETRRVEITSTPDRQIAVIVTTPANTSAPCPAVVCIHGHGGTGESVHQADSIYKGFAAQLAARGFVTIAANVGQHEVYEVGRTLMGERLWDLMRSVDLLGSMPEVDANRIGCGGLSLGGEMAMWLGAMETRVKATVSAGFLTRMDQMEENHCMCWKFDGLREIVDFADIYGLIAPRALQCQIGEREPETDFPPTIARAVLPEIAAVYEDLGAPASVELVVHGGAHEIALPELLAFFGRHLGVGRRV